MMARITINQHHPLFLAIFRALAPASDSQDACELATSAIISHITAAGLKVVPDYRKATFKKYRHDNPDRSFTVPLDGDVAFSQGWDVTASPHEALSLAHLRWLADWHRANADAYEAHQQGCEDAAKEQGRG